MKYLIFEDPTTKICCPVIVCNHLDPTKVSVNGMRLMSGGELNISPEAGFTTQPSEMLRSDDQGQYYIGAALQGLSEPSFRRRVPVLLFKLSGDTTVRKAHSIQELLDTQGFPENVVWVSQAKGTEAFDKFFEVTPGGEVKIKEQMLMSAVEEYASDSSKKSSGVSGFITKDFVITVNKTDDVYADEWDSLGSSSDTKFRYDDSSGTVYWWLDKTDAMTVVVGNRLVSMGFRPRKHITLTKEGQEEAALRMVENSSSSEEVEVVLKKPQRKKK